MDVIIDVETVPQEKGLYVVENTDGEKDISALSPITGKIVALGIGCENDVHTFVGNEKEILTDFWNKIHSLASTQGTLRFVGFNIKHFDMHFLYVRSLAHRIKVISVAPSMVVDLRDVLSFFQYRKKGTLADYAKLIGEEKTDTGLIINEYYEQKNFDAIKKYLEKDISLTRKLYERCKEISLVR